VAGMTRWVRRMYFDPALVEMREGHWFIGVGDGVSLYYMIYGNDISDPSSCPSVFRSHGS